MKIIALLLVSTSVLSAQPHTWQTTDYVQNMIYRDIEFSDSLHGLAVGNFQENRRPTIKRTTDGGKTWNSILEFEIEYDKDGKFVRLPIKFIAVGHPSPEIAIVAADSGMMYRTYNSGATWDTLDFGFDDRFWDIKMSDVSNGVASTSTQAFNTTDGGKTWTRLQMPQSATLRDIAFYNGGTVIWQLVSNSRFGIAKRSPGDLDWTQYEAPHEYGQMEFLNSSLGWVVGLDVTIGQSGNDRIYRTTDGGETWESLLEERIDPAFGLLSIDFVDEKHGIAGGRDGKILRTNDGGQNWIVDDTEIEEFVANSIMRVVYVKPDLALAVTATGYIIRYYSPRITSVDLAAADREPGIQLFPNPAGHALTILIPQGCLNNQIEIFNLTGHEVLTIPAQAITNEAVDIDVSMLPPGLYHIKLSGCDKTSFQQLVIAR